MTETEIETESETDKNRDRGRDKHRDRDRDRDRDSKITQTFAPNATDHLQTHGAFANAERLREQLRNTQAKPRNQNLCGDRMNPAALHEEAEHVWCT